INKGVEMKTSRISETSNSQDTAGTITKQPHNRPSKSAIRQKQRSALQAQSRSLISAAKTRFKKQMAEFAKQASLIENEKLRTDILNLIRSIVRSLPGYRNWDDLSKFVESSTD